MIKQYEDAKQAIPRELLPENQEELDEQEREAKGEKDRSWFSYMTFGMFD